MLHGLDQLESRTTEARVAGVAGVAITAYGFLGRSNCQEPALGDPDFAAKSDAWGRCDRDNIDRMGAFSF